MISKGLWASKGSFVLHLIQSHFVGMSTLLGNWSVDRAEKLRAEAYLDGLRIEGRESVALARMCLEAAEDEEEVAASALVILECGESKDAISVVNRLAEGELETCDAIRRGLRLALIGKIRDDLNLLSQSTNMITRATVIDVLSFHRYKVTTDLSDFALHDEPMVRRCAAEAAGRVPNSPNLTLVRSLIADPIPAVRRSALRAAARLGMQGLSNIFRTRAVANEPCLESIRFLAICGTESDAKLLVQLSKNETTALVAVKAMGGVGAPVLIPFLIELLADPALGDAAAQALQRITFYSVPRGAPPEPPSDATEEVLDFWNPPSPPVARAAEAWWNENRSKFHEGKRYQAGICVSENPLGEHFDLLPDEVRYDLYLRERSTGGASVPDWELETWPQYERNPSWALNKI